MALTGILDRILSASARRLAARKKRLPLAGIQAVAAARRPRGFLAAIRGKRALSIIAELKRSSPSSPRLAPKLDLAAFANAYRDAGAAALSVLTDQDYFGGSLSDLRTVSDAVSLPALRKDFIVDEYQIYEAKAFGASAVLLIVRALDLPVLTRLHLLARKIGLAALVEIHDEQELDTALRAGAALIGVNNRNLATLKTDLGVARRILPLIPKSCVSVAESGYSDPADLANIRGLADAVLIGTAFLKNPEKMRAIMSPGQAGVSSSSRSSSAARSRAHSKRSSTGPGRRGT